MGNHEKYGLGKRTIHPFHHDTLSFGEIRKRSIRKRRHLLQVDTAHRGKVAMARVGALPRENVYSYGFVFISSTDPNPPDLSKVADRSVSQALLLRNQSITWVEARKRIGGNQH